MFIEIAVAGHCTANTSNMEQESKGAEYTMKKDDRIDSTHSSHEGRLRSKSRGEKDPK